MIFGLWSLVFVPLRASAGPGGHGGGGGHSSGGHGGSHSSRGWSGSASSHANGVHSVGHSITHFFGRHGKSVDWSQSPAANPKLVKSEKLHHGHHRSNCGVGGCPTFEFPANRLFWRNRFNCINSGFFFFDPFFLGGFSLAGWDDSPIGPMDAPLPDSVDQSGSDDMSGSNFNMVNDAEDTANREPPMTLLQLRDGSMYGLIEYWVEGDELHYVTTYGGRNSVRIQHINFEKTANLNADRGVEFVLRPRPAQPH